MIEFEEYKGKLNGLKPTLDSLREALHLEAAEKEIEELEGQSARDEDIRSEEHTSELQSPVPIPYAVFHILGEIGRASCRERV